MLTKRILSIFSFGVSLMIFWFIQNGGLPLGYDHGSYKHLLNLLEKNTGVEYLPLYLRNQFEPFSGVFFYTTTTFTGKEIFFGWGYLGIFILTSISFFLLGKNKKHYTIGSYLGLFLFFFSSIQYMNLWWSFGKQMFATLFLLLLLRYHHKGFIAFLFTAVCISLHRLTGFVAILYLIIAYLTSQDRGMKKNYPFIFGVIVAAFSYMGLFWEQIYPSLNSLINKTSQQFFITTPYGTGFSANDFWSYIVPVLLMFIFGFIQFYLHKKTFLKNPNLLTCGVLIFLVSTRFMAYTRMGSFVDLFLIIGITKFLYHSFQKKWIYTFLVLQLIVWGLFVNKWHTPFIDREELGNIVELTRTMPKNVTPVVLSGGTMSMMTGYTDREIYSPKQGISASIWSKNNKILMKKNKSILCQNLSLLPGNVVIYVGSYEDFSSLRDNACLKEIKKWNNGARLFLYLK